MVRPTLLEVHGSAYIHDGYMLYIHVFIGMPKRSTCFQPHSEYDTISATNMVFVVNVYLDVV